MSNLYETWILKQEIPEPFAGIVQKNGGRRTSLKQEDCSRYNTGRAKSAVLHPPTLRAILSLLRLMDGRESGAAGHFSMDPATAVAELTGTYPAGIPKEEAFRKILEEIYQRGYDRAKGEKDFIKKESTIIQACRMPSVIEIQEVSMIEKPGTLTRLNALFDDCAKTDLLNGELIERHPDTVVIFTANLDYIGCQMFNESVLSRMNLIQHRKGMSAKDMARRAVERTGCEEFDTIYGMAQIVTKIHRHLLRKQVQGGVCGYRELENWVWSYLASGDVLNASFH